MAEISNARISSNDRKESHWPEKFASRQEVFHRSCRLALRDLNNSSEDGTGAK